jgi:dimethylglycine dehydrogenase
MVAAEVRAVRERVGIMDVTAFTKVEVSMGRMPRAFLDRLIANRMPKPGASA